MRVEEDGLVAKKLVELKKKKKDLNVGTSLVVHWLRLCDPSAGGAGLIPGQVAKIPAAMVQRNKQKCKSKNYSS